MNQQPKLLEKEIKSIEATLDSITEELRYERFKLRQSLSKDVKIKLLADCWFHQMNNNYSNTLTSNARMPCNIELKLLDDEPLLTLMNLNFTPKYFPSTVDLFGSRIDYDLDILAGLQSEKKKDNLTVFRAVRFPTYKRIYDTVTKYGLSMSNLEQKRLKELYSDKEYVQKRKEIQTNPSFWFQPQERIVDGLPVFALANDALQIHKAYKNENLEKTLLITAHIPYTLIKSQKIKFISNTVIDHSFDDDTRDSRINNFKKQKDISYSINYSALRAKGVELYEMYLKGLPNTLIEQENLGIEQKFYLIDLHSIKTTHFKQASNNTRKLLKYEYFLHGFFGDHNLFGRAPTNKIPYFCNEVTKKQLLNK